MAIECPALVGAAVGAGIVESTTTVTRTELTWNLTVDVAHTFFVGGGEWLVHNACPQPVKVGDVGSYKSLSGLVNDGLSAHHMPQAALGFTSKEAGGAVVIPRSMHLETRTFEGRGSLTAAQDSRLSFRQVLAKDLFDLRSISIGSADFSEIRTGMMKLIKYYKSILPGLISK